jgi:hypothetical protein
MAGKPSAFAEREGVEIVPEYFRSERLDRPFNAVICRHVLEHLDTPMTLLADIRRAIGDRNVPVYFEVPNAGWMLNALSMWDVIYEHVGYWTAPAMEAAFRRAGFAPPVIREGYDRQFLMLEVRPAASGSPCSNKEQVATNADAFAAAVTIELDSWRSRLSALGGKAVIWGAGSKGITFANALGPAAAPLIAFVDLNTRKQGLYVPGVALPVIGPEDLPERAPDLVLISNSLYEAEIRGAAAKLGISAKYQTIAG